MPFQVLLRDRAGSLIEAYEPAIRHPGLRYPMGPRGEDAQDLQAGWDHGPTLLDLVHAEASVGQVDDFLADAAVDAG